MVPWVAPVQASQTASGRRRSTSPAWCDRLSVDAGALVRAQGDAELADEAQQVLRRLGIADPARLLLIDRDEGVDTDYPSAVVGQRPSRVPLKDRRGMHDGGNAVGQLLNRLDGAFRH